MSCSFSWLWSQLLLCRFLQWAHSHSHVESFYLVRLVELSTKPKVVLGSIIFGLLFMIMSGLIHWYFIKRELLAFILRGAEPAVLAGMLIHAWLYKSFQLFHRSSTGLNCYEGIQIIQLKPFSQIALLAVPIIMILGVILEMSVLFITGEWGFSAFSFQFHFMHI